MYNNQRNKQSGGMQKNAYTNVVSSLNNEKPKQNSGPLIMPEANAAVPVQQTVPQQKAHNFSSSKKSVKIIPLGGVGEIGKNMTAFEYDNEIIIVDVGSRFPDEEMPGIDLIIQDITYLVQNKNKVKAVLLTHGHEDHIGGLPYFLREINVPVYGSNFTLGLVEKKMHEHKDIKWKGILIKSRQQVKIGSNFFVEFIKVCHSIAGAMALAIKTPIGTIVQTGDFKIDWTPMESELTDLARFSELGKLGVLALLCDSTNVCVPGYTKSERSVGATLDVIFNKHKEKRLFVTTFASNTGRLQQIFDLAEKHKRKVVFSGRSMINVSEIGIKLGELKVNKNNIIDIDRINNYKDSELCIVTTGSQGEPMSALSRMANGEFNKIKIDDNDCIILSSSPIPGNEKMINRVINALYKKGATVIDDELDEVHASGHACQEEIKAIHSLVKPRFFIPVHGEYRHLKRHEDLAVGLGMDKRNVYIPDIGHIIELNTGYIKCIGETQAGERLVDGLGVGETGSVVLRDRKQLSEDGLAVVIVGINSKSGLVTSGPDIISRGLIYNQEINDLIGSAKETVIDTLKNMDTKNIDLNELKNTLKRVLLNFFYKKTGRRPMILAIVIPS